MSPFVQHIITSICMKNNQLYQCIILHNRCKIVLYDKYKLIPKFLVDFQGMFDLEDGKKEAIPYEYYTLENILLTNTMVPI